MYCLSTAPKYEWTKKAIINEIACEFGHVAAEQFKAYPQWFLMLELVEFEGVYWVNNRDVDHYELDTDKVEKFMNDMESFKTSYEESKKVRKLIKKLQKLGLSVWRASYIKNIKEETLLNPNISDNLLFRLNCYKNGEIPA